MRITLSPEEVTNLVAIYEKKQNKIPGMKNLHRLLDKIPDGWSLLRAAKKDEGLVIDIDNKDLIFVVETMSNYFTDLFPIVLTITNIIDRMNERIKDFVPKKLKVFVGATEVTDVFSKGE